MALLSILDRFRPVGAPGPAGPVGVPPADDQGPAAELTVVFAALEPYVELCRRLVDEARAEAEHALPRARDEASAILAQARLAAGAARARAAAHVEQTASQQDERLRRLATVQAAELAEAGSQRMPDLVADIVDTILSAPLMR